MQMIALHLCTFLLAIAASGLVALTPSVQAYSSDQTPTTTPSQPEQQTPSPPPHPLSRSPLRFALPRREYACAGGARVVILFETTAARLTLNDRIFNMKPVESAAATKYVAGSVVWSSTGEDGFLVDNADPAHPKMLAEECHLQSSFPLAASTSTSIKGTATFGQHPALLADAVLIVQLRDLRRDADDPAAVLAEERVPLGGRKSPVSFALRYDPAKITVKAPLGVSASITGNGKLLFVLVKAVTLPDLANPAPISLTLSRATPNKGQTPPVPGAPPHF
jgi:putative lipoprotein